MPLDATCVKQNLAVSLRSIFAIWQTMKFYIASRGIAIAEYVSPFDLLHPRYQPYLGYMLSINWRSTDDDTDAIIKDQDVLGLVTGTLRWTANINWSGWTEAFDRSMTASDSSPADVSNQINIATLRDNPLRFTAVYPMQLITTRDNIYESKRHGFKYRCCTVRQQNIEKNEWRI